MDVKIKLLYPHSKVPVKAHPNDACYDVTAAWKQDLGDGRIYYGLGFAIEADDEVEFELRSRSGIDKTGLILSNGVGTIEGTYRDEWQARFYHIVTNLKPYEVGDRIAQIKSPNDREINWIVVDHLNESERKGGFGSTGR